MPVVHHPLGLNLLEDQLLVGKRVDGQPGDAGRVVWFLPVAGFGEREVESLGVALRQVVSNAGSFQYDSKVASNFRMSVGVATSGQAGKWNREAAEVGRGQVMELASVR